MFVPVRSRGRSGGVAAALALALALAPLLACAPKQHISLDSCLDEQVVVYVDGRLLEGGSRELMLSSTEPHVLFVKREGETPRRVVLEATSDGDGRPRLEPADPCTELVAIGLGRELQIEVEEEGEAADPAPAPAP